MDWIKYTTDMLALYATAGPAPGPQPEYAGQRRAQERLEARKAVWAATPPPVVWNLPDGSTIAPTRQGIRAYQRKVREIEAAQAKLQAKADAQAERSKGKIRQRWVKHHQTIVTTGVTEEGWQTATAGVLKAAEYPPQRLGDETAPFERIGPEEGA